MRRRKAGWMAGILFGLTATVSAGEVAGTGREAPVSSLPDPVPDAAVARQVFGRFQKLSGDWRGRSTKGWTDQVAFRVIAAGSVVVATSEFEAHPDETMMTVYHLDGDRLMLTHYCVAGNQPRLEMTSTGESGKKVGFSFRDGTNLASRDQGHMDRVVFEFQDEEHFSARWSFYKNGQEAWMEEIHFERIR